MGTDLFATSLYYHSSATYEDVFVDDEADVDDGESNGGSNMPIDPAMDMGMGPVGPFGALRAAVKDIISDLTDEDLVNPSKLEVTFTILNQMS